MSKKLRVGLIGAGTVARVTHLPGYQRLPQVEVVAIADADVARAQELAQAAGVPQWFEHYEEMLESCDLDVVSVVAPNAVHAPATLAALRAGAHVLCEKPMALNAAEAAKMVATARQLDRRLMIGFHNRFNPPHRYLKERVDAGDLGDLYYARAAWMRRKGIPLTRPWFTDRSLSGGGVLIDIGVHMLDLTLWFMGMPDVNTVRGVTYTKYEPPASDVVYNVDDLACALVHLSNGATLVLEVSWFSYIERDQRYWQLLGSRGGAHVETAVVGGLPPFDPLAALIPPHLRIYTDFGGESADIIPDVPAKNWPDTVALEIAHFIACIEQGREPDASGRHGLIITQVVEAIYRSAALGREVQIQEIFPAADDSLLAA